MFVVVVGLPIPLQVRNEIQRKTKLEMATFFILSLLQYATRKKRRERNKNRDKMSSKRGWRPLNWKLRGLLPQPAVVK